MPQLRAAKFRGAHVGAGGGGQTHWAGRWAQAQSDARIGDATAWCVCMNGSFNIRTDGSARYVDGTGRLPVSSLNDTYLVLEAPQGA
eukprot:4221572-Prymnesium_polylepis.1